jgi:hypothetical protein
MHEFEAEGFDHHEPGAKKILRIAKNPVGIHERWAGVWMATIRYIA